VSWYFYLFDGFLSVKSETNKSIINNETGSTRLRETEKHKSNKSEEM